MLQNFILALAIFYLIGTSILTVKTIYKLLSLNNKNNENKNKQNNTDLLPVASNIRIISMRNKNGFTTKRITS